MPRYGYMRPRAKVYAYNYGYMNNYIQPMTHYMSSRETTPAPIDKPGAMVLAEVEKDDLGPKTLESLRGIHPYRLPIEDVKVPPSEDSYWPENVPHFNLVSSYDLMVQYLGIKKH